MSDTVRLLVCQYLHAEATAACEQSTLRDIVIHAFASKCDRSCMSANELERFRSRPEEPLHVFGGPCIAKLDTAECVARGIHVHRFNVCQEMLLNPFLVNDFVSHGAYLATQGWLCQWRERLAEQGHDPALIRCLWKESITKLLLLESGVGEPQAAFDQLCEFLEIPGEVIPIGLDHLRLLLEREVLETRLKLQRSRAEGDLSQAQREAADRATAIDFLGILSQSLKENDVVQGIVNLFTMLFQANEVSVLPVIENDGHGTVPFTETESGFSVILATSTGAAGTLKVAGLAHPQYKKHYLNLALSMAGVCALAIQNARIHRMAEESRRYQRLILKILDVYYQPQDSGEDNRRVLEFIQAFSSVDALSLWLRDDDHYVCLESKGYPSKPETRRQARDLKRALLNPEMVPAGCNRSPRGSLWIHEPSDENRETVSSSTDYPSEAVIQIRLNDLDTGLIQLHSGIPNLFSATLIEQLEGVARSIGIGLERRWAENNLRTANQELESRVLQRTRELATINQELLSEIQERTRAESHLESKSLELQVRLKELHSLYDLSNLFDLETETVDDLCQRAVAIIPKGWSNPERTWARLRIGNKVFMSEELRVCESCLSEPLTVNGRLRGWLEIFVEAPVGSAPFLREERQFIKTIRDLLQGLIDHIETATEKRKVEQQLIQSQKLEALGTLAGGIAHDFNNALTPILALSELSLTKLPEDSQVRHHIDLIMKSGTRAKGLVDQILLFSRKRELGLQPVELTPLLNELLKLLRSTLPSTIDIRLENSLEHGRVMGDQTQIHQIIMNLCTNAYHAMKESGGTLAVRLGPYGIAPGDSLHALGLSPGEYAQLEVSDTGCGMKPEIRSRIFEPFFTTKGPGEGTGMGLSVVHGIVSSYHGHISVYSEPGQGTIFRIYLPLLSDANPDLLPAQTPMEAPRGTERILIVDDEEGIRASLHSMLQELGYETVAIDSAVTALDRIQSDPEAFDLILTDMTLPKMTGLELAHHIHERYRNLPVVLCSGFSDRLTPERMSEAGIREFVHKPFRMMEIASALRKELDRVRD